MDNTVGKVTVSIYLDNWSPYHLKHTRSHTSGQFLVKAADVSPKSRALALRSVAKGSPDTAGVSCWVITAPQYGKISRMCVAWDVGNSNKATTIATSIGDKAPTFESKQFGCYETELIIL